MPLNGKRIGELAVAATGMAIAFALASTLIVPTPARNRNQMRQTKKEPD